MTNDSDMRALAAVVEAALRGQSGILVTGAPGARRSEFVSGVVAVLPANLIATATLDVNARTPGDLRQAIDAASKGRPEHAHVLVCIGDADTLPSDTLHALNVIAGDLLVRRRGLQLLLAAGPDLTENLCRDGHTNLLRYLHVRRTLRPLENAGAAERPAPATRRLVVPAAGTSAFDDELETWLWGTETPRRQREAPAKRMPAAIGTAGSVVVLLAVLGGATFVLWPHSGPDPVADLTPAVPVDTAQANPPDPRDEASDPVSPASEPAVPALTPPEAPAPHVVLAAPAARPELPGPLPNAQSTRQPGTDERSPKAGPGLLLVARPGDTFSELYRRIYAGVSPPSYAAVLAINPDPVRPGTRLLFPTPPNGWAQSSRGSVAQQRTAQAR